MFKFKSPLAHNIFNFAIRVEKISKNNLKREDIEHLEILAKLQGGIENNLKQMYEDMKQVEMLIQKTEKR